MTKRLRAVAFALAMTVPALPLPGIAPAPAAAAECNARQADTDPSVTVCFTISNRSYNVVTNEVTFTATAIVSGGHTPYTYEWYAPSGGVAGTSPSMTMTVECRNAPAPYAEGYQLTVGTSTYPAFIAVAYPTIPCGSALTLDLTSGPATTSVGGTTTTTFALANVALDPAYLAAVSFFRVEELAVVSADLDGMAVACPLMLTVPATYDCQLGTLDAGFAGTLIVNFAATACGDGRMDATATSESRDPIGEEQKVEAIPFSVACTPDPTPEPTPDPTPEPTPDPTPEPTPDPTPEPTPDPTPEPTPDPTPEPSPTPDLPPSPSPEGGVLNATARLDDQAQHGSELTFAVVGEAFDGQPPYAYKWTWGAINESVLGSTFQATASCAVVQAHPTVRLSVEDASGQMVEREVELPKCAAAMLPDTAVPAESGLSPIGIVIGLFVLGAIGYAMVSGGSGSGSQAAKGPVAPKKAQFTTYQDALRAAKAVGHTVVRGDYADESIDDTIARSEGGQDGEFVLTLYDANRGAITMFLPNGNEQHLCRTVRLASR